MRILLVEDERRIAGFRTVANKQNIRLEYKTPEEMKFSGDAQMLRRIFSNLIDNALKHAESLVKITAERRDNFYEINVSDDGSGIPANAQPHIFERFYRAKKARLREEENISTGSGAGLGLAISKFIAEAHEGTLALIKSDATGSIFSIQFPAEK